MKISPRIKKELKHLLLSEIQALQGLDRILNKHFEDAVTLLSKINGKIIICGLGKSGHVGTRIASTMNSLGVPAVFIHPGDAFHGDIGLIKSDDAVIAISFSGETKELINIIKHLKQHNIPIIALTGKTNSKLTKLSDISLVFTIKEEGSPFNLAPMASVTATSVIGDLLATALSLKKDFNKKDFADVHPGGSLGLQLTKVNEIMLKNKDIPIVSINDSFIKATTEMTKKKLGIAGVIDVHKKLTGVITDGDIRRFLQSGKMRNDSLSKDAMTKNPKTIHYHESLQAAIVRMEQFKITAIFVTDHHGHLMGMINLHDIVERNFL